jgi:hypothetical protein
MKRFRKTKHFISSVYYSFPVQLLMNNIKKNQILLFLWAVLFAVITQNIFSMVGAPYLFLDPEYMGVVDFRGFFLIGISIGIFIMSFHITTYILDSYRFPFLGSISRPFTKFCINNSIIPFAFIVVYTYCIIDFQITNGFQKPYQILYEVLSFLAGVNVIIFVLFSYFWSTNKDIFKELAVNLDKKLKMTRINRVNVMRKIKSARKDKYKVTSYLSGPFKVVKCPEHSIYEKEILLKIFDQNHFNAVIVEIIIIVLIILLGFFMDDAMAQIPAAASGILLLSMFVMFTGAFSYWMRGWAITGLIAMLILFNLLVKNNIIESDYKVYGINYQEKPVEYNLNRLRTISNRTNIQEDRKATLEILENWKKKFPNEEKPKMIFICTSGGGQRAAVWTLNALQNIDKSLEGDLMKRTFMISGASGGLIGAAYYRELYLAKQKGAEIDMYDDKHFKNISKDILNPMIFSLVVNDLFLRFQTFEYNGQKYLKDRGYAFEQQLNKNLDNVFDKKLMDYYQPEKRSEIPMLMISPTVINDGRPLFISPQGVSYLTMSGTLKDRQDLNQKIKGIEYSRFFENHDADQLRFLSALRMSATFPYITPNVGMPSKPKMEIMDAGLSDNFGIRDAVSFLFVFKDWIAENTGGVVFIEIRDSEKDIEIESKIDPSILQKLTSPIGGLYNNWDYFQDISNDNMLEFSKAWFKNEINVIDFQYIPKPQYWNKLKDKNINPKRVEDNQKSDRAALSWHLTVREKESLKRTIEEGNNQASLVKLKMLIAPTQ